MRNANGFVPAGSCLACQFRQERFFCQLSPAELKDFDAIKSVSAYPAAATLFVEQQRPRGIYILCQGQVKLFFGSRDGKTLVLRIATSGEVLGLSSALSGKPHEVTAMTQQPSLVAFVSGSDFQRFLRKHPAVYGRVASHMGLEYKAACEQLRVVGLGARVFERLARFLLAWSARERATGNGASFRLPLNHEEIAEYIGTTRESVTRTLSAFRGWGLIESRGSAFLIPDRTALEQFATRQAGSSPAAPQMVRPVAPVRQRRSPGVGHSLLKRVASR